MTRKLEWNSKMSLDYEALRSEVLRPLGATFGGRYWPVKPQQIAEIEALQGWPLPADYRRYLEAIGLAGADRTRGYQTPDRERPVEVEVLYGHHPLETIYNVIEGAGHSPVLSIGVGSVGVFYIDEAGAVLYEENTSLGATALAPSFTDFITNLADLH